MVSWLLLYGIAKGSIIGLVLIFIPWLWGTSTLIPVDYLAEDMFTSIGYMAIGVLWEGGNLEDRDNAVDVSVAPLLREFVYSLVKGRFTNIRSTTIKI